MYKILICDDEKHMRETLEQMVVRYSVETNTEVVIETLADHAVLLDIVGSFNLVFLDICFSGVDTGVELARKARQKGYKGAIVYVTSLSEYMAGGYEVDAFRYICKPVEYTVIKKTLDSYIAKLTEKRGILPIKTKTKRYAVHVGDIYYLESNRGKTVVATEDENITCWVPLCELYDLLPKNSFVYVNQSYLVNLEKVHDFDHKVVRLTDGISIKLTRAYKASFIEQYDAHTEAALWGF